MIKHFKSLLSKLGIKKATKEECSYKKVRKTIEDMTDIICKEVYKEYPQLGYLKYEKGGDMWTFRDRIRLCLSFELIFCGIINEKTFDK